MKRAIILSGGVGERLRPLTADKPKAMVEINGKPIMAYQIEWLSSYGIEEIFVACGYRHEVMKDYFGDGKNWQVKIEYLVETKALGRGGALKSAMKHLLESNLLDQDGMVLALNGDLITNLPIDELIKFYKQHRPTAVVCSVPLTSPFGIIEIEDDSVITRFTEKPKLPFWINAGVYALAGKIINLLPDVGDHEIRTLPELAKARELRAFKSQSYWRTLDTIKDVTELQKELTYFGHPAAVTT
jgi:NDP-sugar pyrophosphorylase family protein